MTTPTSENPMPYNGPERRASLHFSESQLDELAERAATRAVEHLTEQAYMAIGKGVVSRLLWIIGVLAAGLGIWATKNGWIKVP